MRLVGQWLGRSAETLGLKQRRLSSRTKLAAAAVASALLLVMLHAGRGGDDRRLLDLRFFSENQRFMDEVNATDCRLPTYDLFSPDILKYVRKPPDPIVCGRPQPYLTHLDWGGRLHLNDTEVRLREYSDLYCSYEVIVGDKKDDYKVFYLNETEIKSFPVQIDKPVIRVRCSNNGAPIYVMIHSQILPLEKQRVEANKAIPDHRPSVLIFTIDSMSRGNFIRTLPKTYKYLTKQHDMTVFKGLNKVADNTFPNMMAFLAGFMGHKRPEMPHVPVWTIKQNSTMKRYDDMPIIWKDFHKTGYITMYAEEYLDGTFSLLDVGFQDDPTDYYYRSSYVSIKKNLGPLNKGTWSHRKYCVGNEPSYKYIMNYTEEFLTEMSDKKYFAFSFLVEVSHDYLNDIKNLDGELLEFFQRMFNGGMFNNTIVLVMGDHGHRFDDIRTTFIGRIEERMPFLGIILPETLRKSHPHLQLALESHTERLLSWFDIHEALVDIASDDIMEVPINPRPKAIGKSILKFFDDNRTCTEIGILPEYCMCDREAQIPINSPKAHLSADIIIKSINNRLKTSSSSLIRGETRKCATLSLHKIISASMSMKSFSANPPAILVRVVIEAYPSKGLFEAAVEYLPSSQPQVLGDVNRINKYGSQPSCISHDVLRLYCYCV